MKISQLKASSTGLLAGTLLLTSIATNSARAATLGGRLFATGEDASVRVLSAEAGLTSFLSLSSPEPQFIATNRDSSRVFELGNFEAGTELIFSILAGGNRFYSGPASRNADGIAHALVRPISPGVVDVGFEDLWGGGDRDYDDNRFRFYGVDLNSAPVITSLTPDLTIRNNELFDFFVTATDPDIDDVLTYQWDLNGDGEYDDFTETNGQWSFANPGVNLIGVQVSDRYGLIAEGSFNVETVPEPTMALGLLMFGTVGKFLRRKGQNTTEISTC